MPKKETPFLQRITNLTDFIEENFEPSVTTTSELPDFFSERRSDPIKVELGFEVIIFYFTSFNNFTNSLKSNQLNVSKKI